MWNQRNNVPTNMNELKFIDVQYQSLSQWHINSTISFFSVPVQTPNQVKITDFGLAKLLAYNQGEYHAAGGKVGSYYIVFLIPMVSASD